jgi:hypothetical protein
MTPLRGTFWWGLIVAAALLPCASAEPVSPATAEIDYLLKFVGSSACDFNRNGTWYDSKQAEAHLRLKYEYLTAHGGLTTAERFIERVATKSSLSGRPYLLRCGDGKIVTSESWLRSALAHYRASHAP